MKGERLRWFQLADEKCLPLQRCQQETTSSEFVEWNAYRKWKHEQEQKHATKIEYYLAQLACILINSNRKKGQRKLRIKDCLLEFSKASEGSSQSKSDRTKMSKLFWMGLAKSPKKDTPKRKSTDLLMRGR